MPLLPLLLLLLRRLLLLLMLLLRLLLMLLLLLLLLRLLLLMMLPLLLLLLFRWLRRSTLPLPTWGPQQWDVRCGRWQVTAAARCDVRVSSDMMV